MATSPMLVAGGGIAGLAAALGLARIGRPSIVMEQAAAFETAGAGLQLGPNAVRALQWLGAWDALAPSTVAPGEIVIRDGLTGATLQRVVLGRSFERRFGQPYRVAHRADLLNALLSVARASPLIELRTRCRVEGKLPGHGAGLLGADGIRSTVRAQLVPHAMPQFRGQSIYRALLPLGDAPSAVVLWLCPGGHVVHYPVSAGAALNLVAVTEDRSAGGASWSEPAAASEPAAGFAGCCDSLREIVSGPAAWHKWAAADLPPFRPWSHHSTLLIGDAAHAALPYLAQGAAMALEDAVALSLSLGAMPSTEDAFRAFEEARRPRTMAIAASSRRLAAVYHAKGLSRRARNAALRFAGPGRFLDRLAWIYAYDPARRSSSVNG